MIGYIIAFAAALWFASMGQAIPAYISIGCLCLMPLAKD